VYNVYQMLYMLPDYFHYMVYKLPGYLSYRILFTD